MLQSYEVKIGKTLFNQIIQILNRRVNFHFFMCYDLSVYYLLSDITSTSFLVIYIRLIHSSDTEIAK
jgi:hypothetical protein